MTQEDITVESKDKGDVDKEEESEIVSNFRRYAVLMKASQDKYERIFKLRRDIVIESKRIIFLLHTIDGSPKKESVYLEAGRRLNSLIGKEFKKIAAELKGEDPYLYYRAISAGNQEFIEAMTLLEYLQNGCLMGIHSFRDLPFIPSIDYILGIADLTGELMRRCVSSLGTGDVSEAPKICAFLRQVFSEMQVVAHGRELASKLHTLETSLLKVEKINYNLHLLGNEAPKHALLFIEQDQYVDEGLK